MSVFPARSVRRGAFVAAVALALPVLALTACSPGSPASSKTSTATGAPVAGSPAASATPTPTAAALPADTYFSITSKVRADNGATATLTAVIHQPLAPSDPAAATMVARMLDWCSGEVDAGVLASQKDMMVKVDYSSTVTGGTWPPNLVIPVFPESDYDNVAAAGDPGVVQVEQLGPTPGPGDYQPHCLQPAFLTVGKSGSVYFGQYIDPSATSYLDNDSFWSHDEYGFLQAPAEGPQFTVTSCDYVVTPLGQAHMGGNTSFQRDPGGDAGGDGSPNTSNCIVGGLTGY